MHQNTPDTYGIDDEPWSPERERPDEVIETVIVDGAAMSFRSYRRQVGRG